MADPITSFTPDGGKLVFTFEADGDEKVTAPVVGWAIVNGALDPVVMVDGQSFTTATEYATQLSSNLEKGKKSKVQFETIVHRPSPLPSRLPSP